MKTAALSVFFCACALAQVRSETPAEAGIRKAQEQIAQHPNHAPYYNALAMSYARRARETSDVSYYGKAEEALQKSVNISPDNFEALKVRTWVLLGRHEFAKALESAKALNRKMPDDVTVYGYLVDANAELGNYKEAVDAAQWMLDLRPGNVAGLTRAAYLRELHGDVAGAIELMQMAYDATPLQEAEDRGWLLVQIAHLNLTGGDWNEAEQHANTALAVFPGYHYALGVLGQLRMAQSRYQDAAALFEKRYAAAPHAENLFALAEALDAAGRKQEAEAAFAKFEHLALAESSMADNANHELVAYYADHAHQPQKALRIAESELARRHDIFTRDSYAWALAAAGRAVDAQKEMKAVLASGIRDSTIRRHADEIASLAGRASR